MSADQKKIFNHQFCNTYSDLYPFHLTRNKVSSLFIFSLTIFSTSLLESRAFFSISFSSNSSIIFLAPERFATFSQVFLELRRYIFSGDPDINSSVDNACKLTYFLHPTHLTRYWRLLPWPFLAIIF